MPYYTVMDFDEKGRFVDIGRVWEDEEEEEGEEDEDGIFTAERG